MQFGSSKTLNMAKYEQFVPPGYDVRHMG